MAILNDLIVRGATRCLNTLYANSLQVDSQTISGDLTVNGYTYMGYSTSRTDTKLSVAGITNNQWYRSTGNVGWYNDSYGGGIYMTDSTYVKTYNNKAFYAYNGLYTGSTQQYYLNVNGKLNAADGVFSNNLNVGNSLVGRNISATNLLRAAKYDLQTITQVGSNGTLYVAPSIQFPTSNTTSVATASTSITIIDTNITSDVMAGVVWRPSAKVKISGTINGVVTGTVDGTITSINTSSKTMVIGNLSGGNWSSVVAGTYTKDKIENLNIMMYETYQNSTYYPVGILLTSYGSVGEHTDGTAKTFINIYGGSATKPVVRLGSMTGLDAINGVTPSGWGLYTSNGYFSGLIVSTSGKIGGWSLSTNSLTTGTWGSSSSAMLCTGSTTQKSIGGSPASTSGWVFTAGANFGVTSSGALYANSAHISGEITATSGTIGGASITDGVLLVKDANISGKISASHIDVSSITIGSLSGADNYALKDDVPTTVAELTDSGSYLTTSAASNTYATQTNLNNEINARKAVYGTSSTDAGTATKAVTCSNFALYTGASVTVTFSKTNTSSAPQLNVNSTGAKPIKSYTGANLTEGEYKWAAGATITFTYDGTNWRMQDGGALQAKIDAASSASTASSQAGVATQQATNATNAKTAAESAKTAAESAKTAAQSAKTAAETAQGAAETASSQASSAKDAAVSAKNDAVSAKTDAETAKGQAQTAAGNASQSATNAANSATAAAEVMGGFTILWNYSAFATSDNGEGYLCAFDPATGTKSDANGWVKWNGVKRTITKQMINPNTVLPYNIPIYVVCRLSSATATTGTNYMVWYNSGWKYAAMPTPSAVGGSWTWADGTDIILGKFVETASEAALTEYKIYNPPYTSKQITTNVVTAQSASASAASAAQTATTYITNIDSNNGIRIQPANYSTNKDSIQINSTAITMYRNDVDVMSLGDSSFRMGTASGKHTTINSNGLHVWIGSESTAANEVGLFGSTARIGAPASSRFLLNADSLQAYNSSNVKYFEVSASGLSFGGNAVAKASDIPTTVSQLTDSGNYLTTTVAANTYATQSNFDSLREDFDNYVAPIASKEYLNIIATANDDAKGTFYFGKIKPVDYYTPWKIKYRVQVKINGITDGYETSDIIISGAKNTYYAYQTYNSITNTSYRPYYYHILYTCTQTGISNGYGHLFGISLRYSYNPTTTSNARKINVDVVETEGCTVTLEDAPFLYENAAGTGSTNYVNRYSFDGTTQGYNESGDRNETNHILNNFSGKTGAKGVWGGSLFMKDGNGKYQNICLASDGTATSASSGNGARTIATTKIVNPNGFEVGGNIYYSGSSYNANTNMSSNNVYASYGAFDSRYSINSTLTANFLTPYAPIYLVGTINQTDNLFYLDSTWWTQTANNKNKVYIYIGNVYDSTTSYCRFNLAEDNTWLVYDGSKLINYQKNESDNAAKTATSYITNINNNGVFVHEASTGDVQPTDSNANGVHITDDVDIIRNGEIVATFGSSACIGKEDSAHFLIESGKLTGYRNNESTDSVYFETGDAGNILTETFVGNGTQTRFDLYYGGGINFTTAPADDAEIIVEYITTKQNPYFTFGTRRETADGNTYGTGIGSATLGNSLIASSPFSFAEGEGGIASGYASHAEGELGVASGAWTHVGGYKCKATRDGAFSHGLQTISTAKGGLACGQYNKPDSRYMLCVGNGDGAVDAARSNAFMVTKMGNTITAGRVFSGNSATTGDYRAMFTIGTAQVDNISISANNVSGAKTANATKTGYTPVGVVGYEIGNASTSGTNAAPCFPYIMKIDGNNVSFNIRNSSSSASKIKIVFHILYIATAAL